MPSLLSFSRPRTAATHRLQQQPGRPANWRQQQQGSTDFQPPALDRPAANQALATRQLG